MAQVIKMPAFIGNSKYYDVARWFKNLGDYVNQGDVLLEVEGNVYAYELESYWEGYLIFRSCDEGDEIPLHYVLAVIGDKEESYLKALKEEFERLLEA